MFLCINEFVSCFLFYLCVSIQDKKCKSDIKKAAHFHEPLFENCKKLMSLQSF